MKKIKFLAMLCIVVFVTFTTNGQYTFSGSRIALSNDGNYHDMDDIGSLPLEMAIIAEAGFANKLVHVEYNVHVWENNVNWAGDMVTSVNGASSRWSFPNASIYNVRADRDAAKTHLRDEINASSATDILWIIGAGPMQTIYDAMAAADQAKRQYVRFVSHSTWNDDHGKCPGNNCHPGSKQKADILALPGVTNSQWKQIRDQNDSNGDNDFNTPPAKWAWLQNNTDEKFRFLYQRGTVKNGFDVSDAGMAYWLFTGCETCGWPEVKTLFENGGGADVTPPTVPGTISFGAITQTSIVLNWGASTDLKGVTGYDVFMNGVAKVTVTGTTATITGLTCNTAYTFKVRAKDAAGNLSAFNTQVSKTTAVCSDVTPPTVPGAISFGTTTQTSIVLSWGVSSDLNGVTGYDVFVNGAANTTVTSTTATISGLTCNTAYTFKVRAKDAAGNLSAFNTQVSKTTAVCSDVTPPTVPGAISFGATTQTSIILSWGVSTDLNGVTGYDVFMNGVANTTVTGTTATISGLTCNTAYTFKVRAKDAAGNLSAFNTEVSKTTAVCSDVTPPTVPGAISFGATTQTSIILSWGVSTDLNGVTGYDVFMNGVGNTTVTGTTATISGLTCNTAYTFKVRAKDAAGNLSAFNTQVSKTTAACGGGTPTDITNLTATVLSCKKVKLNWSDVNGETGYRIRRKKPADDVYTNIDDVVANTVTYTDITTAANTNYIYMVRPLVDGVAAALSNTPQVKTPTCLNSAPIASDNEGAGINTVISPNPSDGIINIFVKDNNPVNIVIYDGRGNAVYSAKLTNSTTLDMSKLGAKGMFIVSIDGVRTKLVVQ